VVHDNFFSLLAEVTTVHTDESDGNKLKARELEDLASELWISLPYSALS